MPRGQHQHAEHQWHREDELRARERGQAAEQPEPHRAPQARSVDEAVRAVQDAGAAEDGHALGHEQAVVDPEVRVDGGEHGRGDPDAPARDLPPGEPAQRHRPDAQQAGPEHVRGRRRRVPGRDVRDDPEPQQVERGMGRGLLAGERVDEAAALGQVVPAEVEDQRVVERERQLLGAERQDVGDADREPADRDRDHPGDESPVVPVVRAPHVAHARRQSAPPISGADSSRDARMAP